MDSTIKGLWTGDLRSGNFPQGMGKLHTSTRKADGTEEHNFCCLGVLCERGVEAGIVDRVVAYSNESESGTLYTVYAYVPVGSETSENEDTNYPPHVVREWAGLDKTNPEVAFAIGTQLDTREPLTRTDNLAALNDEGKEFEDIAEAIDKSL